MPRPKARPAPSGVPVIPVIFQFELTRERLMDVMLSALKQTGTPLPTSRKAAFQAARAALVDGFFRQGGGLAAGFTATGDEYDAARDRVDALFPDLKPAAAAAKRPARGRRKRR